MTTPAFHHPVASLWQRCLNAVDAPPRREQRDLPHGALVRARWICERDGETWLDGRVISVWERRGYEDVVLVHRLHRDPRGQTHGEWLWARDVQRHQTVAADHRLSLWVHDEAMNTRPPLGFFGRSSRAPLEIDERRLAEQVGIIVMRAAQVENALEAVTFERVRATTVDRSGISGRSGKRLEAELRKAELDEFADRYMTLAAKRNAIVHGVWSTDFHDETRLVTTRSVIGGASVGDLNQDGWSMNDLADLRNDLERFLEDISDQVLDLVGTPEQVPRYRDRRRT